MSFAMWDRQVCLCIHKERFRLPAPSQRRKIVKWWTYFSDFSNVSNNQRVELIEYITGNKCDLRMGNCITMYFKLIFVDTLIIRSWGLAAWNIWELWLFTYINGTHVSSYCVCIRPSSYVDIRHFCALCVFQSLVYILPGNWYFFWSSIIYNVR